MAVLYLPCEHSLQAAEPFASLKRPTPHGSHSTPSGPVYPSRQVQLVRAPLPPREYVCAGQSLHVDSDVAAVAVLYLPCEHSIHAADPLMSLKLPTSHASHATPSGPV